MNIQIESQYRIYPTKEVEKMFLLYSVESPRMEDFEERKPVSLVAILDTSSSMSDGKLALVQDSLRFMLSHLRSDDRLGLVHFSSFSYELLPLILMDEKGKYRAEKAIEELTPRGGTNLSAGVLKGLKLTREWKEPCSFLLFTDGKANEGITELEGFSLFLQGAFREREISDRWFCFGYGQDHDVELLEILLNQSHEGHYYYIENADSIPTALADCLGGILSTVAQNVVLRAVPESNVTLTKVWTDRPVHYKVEEVCVEWGDFYSEEKRDLLWTLSLTPGLISSGCPFRDPEGFLQVSGGCPLVTFHLEYHTARGISSTDTRVFEIWREEVETPLELCPRVTTQYHRVLTAQALKQALVLAQRKQFHEAQHLLKDTREYVETKADPADPLTECLISDLRKAEEKVTDREAFGRGGYATLLSCSHLHDRQRSYESPCYATSKKLEMIRSFQEKNPSLKSPPAPFDEMELPLEWKKWIPKTTKTTQTPAKKLSQSHPV